MTGAGVPVSGCAAAGAPRMRAQKARRWRSLPGWRAFARTRFASSAAAAGLTRTVFESGIMPKRLGEFVTAAFVSRRGRTFPPSSASHSSCRHTGEM